MNKKDKEKIVEVLEGVKEFYVSWTEDITYSKLIKAKDKEYAKDKFYSGEVIGERNDITDSEMIEDSLEITEKE